MSVFDRYVADAVDRWLACSNERLGQAFFNELAMHYFAVAEPIWSETGRGGRCPFTLDENMRPFLAYVREALDGARHTS